jgi:hypothetical protein
VFESQAVHPAFAFKWNLGKQEVATDLEIQEPAPVSQA